ncbi:MAG: hypothetical protein HYY63_05110 [Elusimicrobia bacterium]|nr:hypothetical protein [Elusimicrobiota bacterium]
MKKQRFLLAIMGFFLIGAFQNLRAQIQIFSTGKLQDRQPTARGVMDQSVHYQFGINGVSPSGGDTDTTHFSVPYQMTYGFLEKLEVGGSWGVHWVDRKNKNAQFGVGDLAFAARYRIFDADRQERMPGLDVEAGLSFPTASFEKGLGAGGLGVLFGWGIVLPFDPIRTHIGLGYRFYTENSDNIEVGSLFSYAVGVSGPVSIFHPAQKFWESLKFSAEVKGLNHARNKISGNKTGPTPDELYLSPGLIWNLKKGWNLHSSLLIGLTQDSSDFGMNLDLRF